MALCPSGKIILESSGELIQGTPGFLSLPRVDDTMLLSKDGGVQTRYKVESVEFELDASAQPAGGGGAQRVRNVNGYVNIYVSEIP